MDLKELQGLELYLTKTSDTRAALGGYSADADAILELYKTVTIIVRHLITEKTPKPRKRKAKKR